MPGVFCEDGLSARLSKIARHHARRMQRIGARTHKPDKRPSHCPESTSEYNHQPLNRS